MTDPDGRRSFRVVDMSGGWHLAASPPVLAVAEGMQPLTDGTVVATGLDGNDGRPVPRRRRRAARADAHVFDEPPGR
jgi:hypothetical protein